MENIKKWKEEGQIIITQATFKKLIYTEDQCRLYGGKAYKKYDWLLTYGHKQYYRLIP